MDTISFELIKKEKFNELKPYGKFLISAAKRPKNLPHIIPLNELRFDSRNTMPTTAEQEMQIIKFMKANDTDILTDGYRYYTRIGAGFGEVNHNKLAMYATDESFRELVDNK